ncbi:uncharacterized protein LOC133796207 [Humulus lupulus]|uniref:uncharacterized protein LOC133796207 n=1 Tax=Humulus lupulus TaxID=3486 RepID=UPI002B405AA8|nr:uncharacterized protein LOC133796207 [Humulus lupulus]
MIPHHSQEPNLVIGPPSSNVSGNYHSNPNSDLDLDVPIALRLGTRSCTQHRISKYFSYSNLSSSFKAFTSSLTSVLIPRNIEEDLGAPEWKTILLKKMKALKQNNTWSLMEFTPDKNIVGCKWVFTINDDIGEMNLIKKMMAKEFEVKDLGALKYFLGMEFARSKKGISVSQRKYTLDLLKETEMLGRKPSKTPIELGNRTKMFEGDLVDKGRY